MRGRKPHGLTVAEDDLPFLERVARGRHLPWFLVERARVILAVAAGQRIDALAACMGCDRTTIWRICRRYEGGGLTNLFSEAPRSGRPAQISPPPAGSDRPTGLPGADCHRAAHHALDQCRSGSPGGSRRRGPGHQRPQRSSHPPAGRSAAAPHPLLEDGASGRAVQTTG